MSLLRFAPLLAVLLIAPAAASASGPQPTVGPAPVLSDSVVESYGKPVSPAVTRIAYLAAQGAALQDRDEDSAPSLDAWKARMIRSCVRTGNRMTC